MSISQLGNGSFRKEVDYKEKILDGDVYLPLYIV